jgi:hypothetical protein
VTRLCCVHWHTFSKVCSTVTLLGRASTRESGQPNSWLCWASMSHVYAHADTHAHDVLRTVSRWWRLSLLSMTGSGRPATRVEREVYACTYTYGVVFDAVLACVMHEYQTSLSLSLSFSLPLFPFSFSSSASSFSSFLFLLFLSFFCFSFLFS